MSNPWNLTPHQARVMDAVVESGWSKVAATRLGLSEWGVRDAMRLTRKKMGTKGMYQHILLWDRWRRSQPEAQSLST